MSHLPQTQDVHKYHLPEPLQKALKKQLTQLQNKEPETQEKPETFLGSHSKTRVQSQVY